MIDLDFCGLQKLVLERSGVALPDGKEYLAEARLARIEATQLDTQAAVEAIGQISEVINRISEIQTAIAGEVEEQTATTNDIGQCVAQAAAASTETAESITRVATIAQGTNSSVGETQRAADQVAQLVDDLQDLVRHFA